MDASRWCPRCLPMGNQHPNSVFTEEMFVTLHELWDNQKKTAMECGAQLRKRYMGYPGSLTRSAVLGLLKRARELPQYKKLGWYEDRTPKGGTKPTTWGGGAARAPLWEQRRGYTGAERSNLPPKLATPARVAPYRKPTHTVANRDELDRRTADRNRTKPTEESFNQKRSLRSGQAIATPAHAIAAAQAGMEETKKAFVPPAEHKPVTMGELKETHCKWPVEVAGQTMYCGKDRIPGRKPYCAEHARR
jgi:hypothetical protein